MTRAVAASGIDPADFTWDTRPNGAESYGLGSVVPSIPVLRHVSGAFFAFEWSSTRGGQHWAYYMPDTDRPERRVSAGTWDHQLRYVHQWLANLRAELDTPRIWDDLVAGRLDTFSWPAAAANTNPNTPFTPAETTQIARALSELEARALADPGTPSDARDELREAIKELTAAAERLGRRDWKRVVLAELIQLTVRATITLPLFHEALHLLDVTLGHTLGGGPVAPGLPAPSG